MTHDADRTQTVLPRRRAARARRRAQSGRLRRPDVGRRRPPRGRAQARAHGRAGAPRALSLGPASVRRPGRGRRRRFGALLLTNIFVDGRWFAVGVAWSVLVFGVPLFAVLRWRSAGYTLAGTGAMLTFWLTVRPVLGELSHLGLGAALILALYAAVLVFGTILVAPPFPRRRVGGRRSTQGRRRGVPPCRLASRDQACRDRRRREADDSATNHGEPDRPRRLGDARPATGSRHRPRGRRHRPRRDGAPRAKRGGPGYELLPGQRDHRSAAGARLRHRGPAHHRQARRQSGLVDPARLWPRPRRCLPVRRGDVGVRRAHSRAAVPGRALPHPASGAAPGPTG